MSTKISVHFAEHEVSKSSTAIRLEIPNLPPREVMLRATELAINVLDPIREHFGKPFSPQSWYRSEELEMHLTWDNGFKKWCLRHNKPWLSRKELGIMTEKDVDTLLRVKKVWDAYFERKSHPRGEAADIEIPGVSNDTLYFWIKDNLAYDQLIREFPKPDDPTSGWVHVSWKSIPDNRNACFSIPYYDKYA